MMEFEDSLRVAVIQNVIDPHLTWFHASEEAPSMDYYMGEKIWNDIMNDFRSIRELSESEKPQIVLIPETSLPLRYEKALRRFAKKLGVILIAGLDFRRIGNEVYNEAVVCIPSHWPFDKGTGRSKNFRFGKKFPAFVEEEHIRNCSKHREADPEWEFKKSEEIYILDLEGYGMVGFTICADFYDIDRYSIYRGRIQHLFLISFNKDLESFRHMAESISRIVYCNVVICNSGYYGGSMVFHPAFESYNRYLFRHEGANLHTMQVIEIPVKRLIEIQSGKIDNAKKNGLKSLPPGYDFKLPIAD